FNELKDYGGKASAKRSAQQTEIARFWLMVGPQAYHPFARKLVMAKEMNVSDSARFMALVAGWGPPGPDRRVRRQVPVQLLAADYRYSQRRYRRQPGYRP